MNIINKVLSWAGIKQEEKIDDKLATIALSLLRDHPKKWKFSGNLAEFSDFFLKINFSSWESLSFNMRDLQEKINSTNVYPSKKLRKMLYKECIECRNIRLYNGFIEELEEKKLLLTFDSGN